VIEPHPLCPPLLEKERGKSFHRKEKRGAKPLLNTSGKVKEKRSFS
jgi:hypothetical protein